MVVEPNRFDCVEAEDVITEVAEDSDDEELANRDEFEKCDALIDLVFDVSVQMSISMLTISTSGISGVV